MEIDMAAAGGAHGADDGAFAFRCRKDNELIELYLRPKIAGRPLPRTPFAVFIHDADIHSAPPGELTAAHAPTPGPAGARRVWYFFSAVRCYAGVYRVGQSGAWIPCTRVKVKADDGGGGAAIVGYTRRCIYRDRAAPSEREWQMVEYAVPGTRGMQQLVLCEVSRRRSARQLRLPPLNDLVAGIHGISL